MNGAGAACYRDKGGLPSSPPLLGSFFQAGAFLSGSRPLRRQGLEPKWLRLVSLSLFFYGPPEHYRVPIGVTLHGPASFFRFIGLWRRPNDPPPGFTWLVIRKALQHHWEGMTEVA